MGEHDADWYRALATETWAAGLDDAGDLLDTVADLLDGEFVAELRRDGLDEAAAHVERLVGRTVVVAGEFSAGACHELHDGAAPCDGCGNTETYETEADGFLVLLCTCGIARSVQPVPAEVVGG